MITVEKGDDIVIEFYPADAPGSGQLRQAAKGLYDGVVFHRRERTPSSRRRSQGQRHGGFGTTIPAGSTSEARARAGGDSAHQDHNSAGSQFYICLAPANFSTASTVFGIVTKGMDVVDKVKVGAR